jgi:uncharacterized membrane protein YfcA
LLAAPILIHINRTDPRVIISVVACVVIIFGAILYSKHGALSFRKMKSESGF